MIAQDLVEYRGKTWLVTRVQEDFGVVTLTAFDGSRVEVADDLETTDPNELKVLAHPATDWPVIAFPSKPGYGTFTLIEIPNLNGTVALKTWQDWVPGDAVREGGVVYFNPALGLRPGQSLTATFKSGKKARMAVTKSFKTVGQRVSIATQKSIPTVVPEERTRFNCEYLLEDD